MEKHEFETHHITKPCAICGIRKPLAAFLLSIIQLSSISKIKKYSDICDQCRSEKFSMPMEPKEYKQNMAHGTSQYHSKKSFKKNQMQDDDDSSGGGKGQRLTSDAYAKMSVIFKRDFSTRIETSSLQEIDTKYNAPNSSRSR